MKERAVFTPTTIFGSDAVRIRFSEPVVLGCCNIAGHEVTGLRYELADFRVPELPDVEGWFVVYRVALAGQVAYLQQVLTPFYVPEGSPEPGDRGGRLPSGDGCAAPRWHKCDRCWPELGGEPFTFLGQGYHGATVVYLFRSPGSAGEYLAIWTDQVDRQDAEEHYRLEEARDREAGAREEPRN